MRVLLVLVGFAVPIITLVAETNSWHDVPIGYFLLGAACILAAALWRNDSRETGYFDTVQRVSGILAKGPLTMEDLLAKLTDGSETPEVGRYRQGIGFMLVEHLLCIDDGQVVLGSGGNQSRQETR